MASSKAVTRLVATYGRQTIPLIRAAPAVTHSFSTSAVRAAAPPEGFRLGTPKRWDQTGEASLDKASKFFLLSEMMRGMYVVLEQFFKPAYVTTTPNPNQSTYSYPS